MPTTDDPPSTALALGPTPRRSLTEAVADQLADVILRSEVRPGERLPSERDLARKLEVSRIVVREALTRLVERGLVLNRPGVGTFVVRMKDEAVSGPLGLYIRQRDVRRDQLFDLRAALEPAIAAGAAGAATARDLDELRHNLGRTDAIAEELETAAGAARDEAIESFAWADVEFHGLLARATGNPLYEVLLNPLVDRLVAVRREGARLDGTARQATREHRQVFDRVARGDAEGARRGMAEHLTTVAAWLEATPDPGGENEPDETERE